jgi:hypothetical protein
MRFDSRRADVPGYLEFIWIEKDLPEGVNPQAIALITDTTDGLITDTTDGHFYGMYGLQIVAGPTVSAVKAELFSLIEAGQ